MYPQFYSYNRIPADIHIVSDITKAINGEYSAIACYAQLAEMASTEKEKKQILEIREDEIKHYNIFSAIYMSLTGKQPTPQITETCPGIYKDGLESAIEDEQKTVDFYLDIADKAQDPYIKKQFRRAATDEQNHAVWFLYFYTKLLEK